MKLNPGVPCPREDGMKIKAILLDQNNEYRCPKDLQEMLKKGNFITFTIMPMTKIKNLFSLD
jgi:hypothetical protein